MKTILLLLAFTTGVMINEANAQTDTGRNKVKLDTADRSPRDKRDTAWKKRPVPADTVKTKKDPAANRNRRDSVQENPASGDVSVPAVAGEKDIDALTVDWPAASRKAADELSEKYGAPDIANEEQLVWKDKGNWEMIIVKKDAKTRNLPEK